MTQNGARKNKLLCKQDLIIRSLKNYYYNKNEKIEKIKDIAFNDTKKNNKRHVSLRIIEWFVTNYAKKYGIGWTKEETIRGNKTYNQFNVFLSYKSQLNAYSKKQFDPFCRRKRIEFEYNEHGDTITTTIGQLNFFRWALENDIIKYVEENHTDIEADMNESIRQNYRNENVNEGGSSGNTKGAKKRKKRNELSKSATRKLNIHNYKIMLSFD
jgi:hypothetical protein